MVNSREESIKGIVDRLFSPDANDRVKAAAEIGEVGTTLEAPIILQVAYEDEASTVRQMAIQAYGEILGIDSFQEIKKAAVSHYDDYVRIYAITVLGGFDSTLVENILLRLINDKNQRIQATVIRAMIHAETANLTSFIFEFLRKTKDELLIRNCIEALALWKFKGATTYIRQNLFEKSNSSLEIQTISAFYLAIFKDKDALQFLMNSKIDEFIRISVNSERYRGRDGLMEAIRILHKK